MQKNVVFAILSVTFSLLFKTEIICSSQKKIKSAYTVKKRFGNQLTIKEKLSTKETFYKQTTEQLITPLITSSVLKQHFKHNISKQLLPDDLVQKLFIYSAKNGHLQMAKYLLHYYHIHFEPVNDAICLAATNGFFRLVKLIATHNKTKYLLVSNYQSNDESADYLSNGVDGALFWTAQSENFEIIKYLIENKTTSRIITEAGVESPFAAAGEKGRLDMIKFFTTHPVTKDLLSEGFDEYSGVGGALLRATENKHLAVITYICTHQNTKKFITQKRLNESINVSLEISCPEITAYLIQFKEENFKKEI